MASDESTSLTKDLLSCAVFTIDLFSTEELNVYFKFFLFFLSSISLHKETNFSGFFLETEKEMYTLLSSESELFDVFK